MNGIFAIIGYIMKFLLLDSKSILNLVNTNHIIILLRYVLITVGLTYFYVMNFLKSENRMELHLIY